MHPILESLKKTSLTIVNLDNIVTLSPANFYDTFTNFLRNIICMTLMKVILFDKTILFNKTKGSLMNCKMSKWRVI